MKSLKSIKAFSLIELSVVVLIIGVLTLVALNGKSLVIKANCVVSSLGSKTIAGNLDNPDALTSNRSTAYETCVSTGGISGSGPTNPGTCAGGSTCSSCKTLLAANPGSASGTYTINPTGSSSFQVYCDMTNDGGGWTKITHYKNAAYTPNTGAVNPTSISTENTAAISGFAKLSDAQINAIGGSGVTKTYRISGDKTTKKYFNQANIAWSDTAKAYGLLGAAGRKVCENTNIGSCTWSSSPSTSYFDSWSDGMVGDNCDRYFADFNSNSHCWNPNDLTKRCITSGASCSSYAIINNLEIYLRE